eukprot:scaffold85434_cov63-Phaeocystis_antarctica.AAC.3
MRSGAEVIGDGWKTRHATSRGIAARERQITRKAPMTSRSAVSPRGQSRRAVNLEVSDERAVLASKPIRCSPFVSPSAMLRIINKSRFIRTCVCFVHFSCTHLPERAAPQASLGPPH